MIIAVSTEWNDNSGRFAYYRIEHGQLKERQEACPPDSTPESLAKYQKAQGELGSALGKLLMIQENYPDLKASANFTQLADELAGTENRIATARRDYNTAVQSYNTAIRKFPTNLIASLFGFTQKAYFQASDGAQNVPNVEF